MKGWVPRWMPTKECEATEADARVTKDQHQAADHIEHSASVERDWVRIAL